MSLAYPVGGSVTSSAVGAQSIELAIPTLDAGGGRAHYVVVQVQGAVVVWVKTGFEGVAEMDGVNQGMLLQRDSGDLVLKVPKGHTHLQTWASGGGVIILTPLSARPR